MAGTGSIDDEQMLRRIAAYDLIARVGEGGMGSVYRARDVRSGDTVALKLIHAHLEGDPEYVSRFEREARIASLMRSPNIVRVFEAGTADGHHYMATEFIEGLTLSAVIDQGPIEAEESLALALQAARALDEAHRHDVVHRDIKPDNIILTTDRAVKVTDFGIAKQRGGMELTSPGVFVGTLAYSAPERFVGDGDIRSDIYSLGVTLFHMLAGERPYRSDSPVGLMRLHEQEPPPMEKLAAAPAAVMQVVVTSLEKNISRRYADPAALISAIEEARRSLSPVVPANWVEQALSRFFDRRVAALVAAGGLVGIACGAAFGATVTPGAALVGVGAGASAGAAGAAGAGGAGSIAAQAGAGASQGFVSSILGGGVTTLVAGAVLVAAVVVIPLVVFVAPSVFGGGDESSSEAQTDGAGVASSTAERAAAGAPTGTLPPTASVAASPSSAVAASGDTNFDGVYTIALAPGDQACGFPSIHGLRLTVQGAVATAISSNGEALSGSAIQESGRLDVQLAAARAQGEWGVNLSGDLDDAGNLRGQSESGGALPGGQTGFSCNFPFTANAPAAASSSAAPTALAAGTDAERLRAAIQLQSPGFGFDPECSVNRPQGPCATGSWPAEMLATGIAEVAVHDRGAAATFYGRTAEGAWVYWFATQNFGGPQTNLPGDMIVCADGDGLNLRAEPSTSAPIVTLIPDTTIVRGDRFVMTDPPTPGGAFAHPDGWYHITSPQEGWAYDRFLLAYPISAVAPVQRCTATWWP